MTDMGIQFVSCGAIDIHKTLKSFDYLQLASVMFKTNRALELATTIRYEIEKLYELLTDADITRFMAEYEDMTYTLMDDTQDCDDRTSRINNLCKENEDKPCYVYYILNQERNKVKIGISYNPKVRAQNIQTASGEEIEILNTIEFASRYEALTAEAYLHRVYGEYRKHPSKVAKSSEWFDAKIVKHLMTYHETAFQIRAGMDAALKEKQEIIQSIDIAI